MLYRIPYQSGALLLFGIMMLVTSALLCHKYVHSERHPKPLTRGNFFTFALSLWFKGGFHLGKDLLYFQ